MNVRAANISYFKLMSGIQTRDVLLTNFWKWSLLYKFKLVGLNTSFNTSFEQLSLNLSFSSLSQKLNADLLRMRGAKSHRWWQRKYIFLRALVWRRMWADKFRKYLSNCFCCINTLPECKKSSFGKDTPSFQSRPPLTVSHDCLLQILHRSDQVKSKVFTGRCNL